MVAMVACLQHIALEDPSQTPLARASTPVKPRDCRAAHVYQGRWLDFLLAVYSLEACEGPSIV